MYISPNPIAWIVLLSWPLVVMALYARLEAGRALIWSVIGAYMLLPEQLALDIPVLPDPDKNTLPVMTAALISWLKFGKGLAVFSGGRLAGILTCVLVLSAILTVLTNTDPVLLEYGGVLPGMSHYDSLAIAVTQILVVLPFFLARRDLATPAAIRDLLLILVICGVIYSFPVMIEARLSPQLHTWVYGYFQHDFAQALRFGGFRPFVFMPHGLWVAFFMLCAFLAAVALLRLGPREWKGRLYLVVPWLAVMLILCKSFGPVGYALLAVPLLLLASGRQILLISSLLAGVVIFYPLLRGGQILPVEMVVDLAARLSEDRAHSFGFRLMNEDALLGRASERPWFGWGGYARGFLFHPVTGQHLTVADGTWIIRISSGGWTGFLAEFGLLCLPVWALTREVCARKGAGGGAGISPFAPPLALIFALNLVDLLPNATLTPLTWLIAGSLLGYAGSLRRDRLAKTAGGVAEEGGDSALAGEPAKKPRRTVI